MFGSYSNKETFKKISNLAPSQKSNANGFAMASMLTCALCSTTRQSTPNNGKKKISSTANNLVEKNSMAFAAVRYNTSHTIPLSPPRLQNTATEHDKPRGTWRRFWWHSRKLIASVTNQRFRFFIQGVNEIQPIKTWKRFGDSPFYLKFPI